MRTTHRVAASATAMTLGLGMFAGAITPAFAAHVEARSIDSACQDAPEDGLQDTGPEGGEAEAAIDCIAWYEVTQGTGPSTYEPQRTVNRGPMAAFISRVLRASETAFAEPTADEDYFTDDDGGIFEDAINFVAKHEVVDGTSDTTYTPGAAVTRGQMAKFLVNQLTAIGATVPEPSEDYFGDDDGNLFEDHINRLAELGIATGVTDTEYRPGEHVTRGQMARFLARSLAELVDQELMLTPAERQVEVALDSTEVEQGSDVAGDITSGSEPQSAVLNGCGFTDEALEDGDTTAAGIQFTATVASDQPLGDCTLTFDVELSNGQSESVAKVITVTDPRDATVILDQRSIAQGQDLTGQIIPDEDADSIMSATASGCGLSDASLTDEDDETDGIQFSVTIPNSAAVGDCTLTIEVNYGTLVIPSGTDTFEEDITVLKGELATGAPELVGVSSPSFSSTACDGGTGDSVTYQLTWDEAITGRSIPDRADSFRLTGYDGADGRAMSAQLSPSNDAISIVCFDAADQTFATTVSVAAGAVGDAGNKPNPEQSLALKHVTLTGATGPRLASVEPAGGTAWDFIFDENVTIADEAASASQFVLAVDNGPTAGENSVQIEGTEILGVSGATVTVDFPALTSSVRRAGAEPTAVDGLESPTVVDYAGGGSTDGPDLTSATWDAAATRQRNIDSDTALETVQVDEVRFVFDQNVLELADNTTKFVLINSDGTITEPTINQGDSGDPVVRSSEDGRIVIVEFPNQALERATRAAVLFGAVEGAAGDQPVNQIDELARTPALTYAAGTTLAPAPQSVSVSSSPGLLGTDYTVTITFDEAVADDFLANTVSLYDDQGRRWRISGTPSRDSDDSSVITVSGTASGTNDEIASNAVLVGLVHLTVHDAQGHANHPQVFPI